MVTIAGEPCDGVAHIPMPFGPGGALLNGFALNCTLRSGTGQRLQVVVESLTITSVPKPFLSYSLPVIDHIGGCAEQPFANETAECPRAGGVRITLDGRNFGRSGALVVFGDTLIADVQHSAAMPHRQLSFVLPPGMGVQRSVVLFQGGGGDIGPSPASVSYHQCEFGAFANTSSPRFACDACPANSYSNTRDTLQCVPCPSGYYPDRPGSATACFRCEAGSYSVSGNSVCSACELGKYQTAPVQARCFDCPAGQYAAQTAALNCTKCPAGHVSTTNGQSSCSACVGILNQPFEGQSQCLACNYGTFFTDRPAGAGFCQSCPPGAVCTDKGVFSAPDTFVYYSEARNELVAQRCLTGYCVTCPTLYRLKPVTGGGRSGGANGTNATSSAPMEEWEEIPNPAVASRIEDGQVFSCCGPNRLPPDVNPLVRLCSRTRRSYPCSTLSNPLPSCARSAVGAVPGTTRGAVRVCCVRARTRR